MASAPDARYCGQTFQNPFVARPAKPMMTAQAIPLKVFGAQSI
jgi:hypothetical protein